MINTVKQGSRDRKIWLFLRLVDNLKNNLKNRKNLIGNKLQHVIHMPSNDICPEPGVTCNFALCCLYRVDFAHRFSGHCELIVLLCQELLALSKQRAEKKVCFDTYLAYPV